ncbi:MAG TPA: response regulator [Gemmatimonadales bacterium]|jgi:CheY-like chemotaxis protein|nr:response regulator [Gemmatimonadales bacterium]
MTAPSEASRTILVVDDEPMVRSVVGRLLQRWGFEVVEADNGKSALLLARNLNGQLCLVITDLAMPHMDGYQFASAFSPLYPDVPVLFVTGKCPNELMGDLSSMQDRLLFKPFHPDALLGAVARLLESKTSQREISA